VLLLGPARDGARARAPRRRHALRFRAPHGGVLFFAVFTRGGAGFRGLHAGWCWVSRSSRGVVLGFAVFTRGGAGFRGLNAGAVVARGRAGDPRVARRVARRGRRGAGSAGVRPPILSRLTYAEPPHASQAYDSTGTSPGGATAPTTSGARNRRSVTAARRARGTGARGRLQFCAQLLFVRAYDDRRAAARRPRDATGGAPRAPRPPGAAAASARRLRARAAAVAGPLEPFLTLWATP
jgi:hypothetical protein